MNVFLKIVDMIRFLQATSLSCNKLIFHANNVVLYNKRFKESRQSNRVKKKEIASTMRLEKSISLWCTAYGRTWWDEERKKKKNKKKRDTLRSEAIAFDPHSSPLTLLKNPFLFFFISLSLSLSLLRSFRTGVLQLALYTEIIGSGALESSGKSQSRHAQHLSPAVFGLTRSLATCRLRQKLIKRRRLFYVWTCVCSTLVSCIFAKKSAEREREEKTTSWESAESRIYMYGCMIYYAPFFFCWR